ncbi:MAG: CHC2 zinc finger domain-containing protein [Syntrophus sp. (in: bacteria)]
MRATKLPDKKTVLARLDIPSICQELIPSLKPSGNGNEQFMGLCPFHDDHHPSLSVSHEGLYQCKVPTCDARGDFINLFMKVNGLDFKGAMKELAERAGMAADTGEKVKQVKTRYDYHGPYGTVLYWKIRIDPGKNGRKKDFYFCHGNNQKGRGQNPVLYNLPGVIEAETVVFTEGEGKSDIINNWKIPKHAATTLDAGAQSKLTDSMTKQVVGKNIVTFPDHDEPGAKYAETICNALYGKCPSIKIVQLPGLPDKGDIVDWVKDPGNTRKKVLELIAATAEWTPDDKGNYEHREPYQIDESGFLCRIKNTENGTVAIRLANFSAQIVEQISEDDGNEIIQKYRLEGSCGGRQLPQIEILAAQFNGMGWIHQWGSRSIIEPGSSIKDTVRHAIQVMSKNTLHTSTYTHTGWRNINGNMIFLTHGSAIGGCNVDVQLAKETTRYAIPYIPDEEIEAIATSLSFMNVGNHDVTIPLFTAVYMSPLTSLFSEFQPLNFSFYSYGQTGTFKTTLAVLGLDHFGNFNATSLPNLEDTANSVERRAFLLKDVLMVLDDYHPSGLRKEAQAKESLVQRVIRAFSNRTGRGRLNSDSKEKGRYSPRGVLLVTGEEIASLQSTIARIFVIEINKGDVNIEKLTALQDMADRLPHAMSSYVHWLRDNMVDLQKQFSARFSALRKAATEGAGHLKLPEHVAFLTFTLEVVSSWLVDKGVFTEADGELLVSEGWDTFRRLTERHGERIKDEDPVRKFDDIILTLVRMEKVTVEAIHDR